MTPILVFTSPPVAPHLKGIYLATDCYPRAHGGGVGTLGGSATFTLEYHSLNPQTASVPPVTPLPAVGPYPDAGIAVCSDGLFGPGACRLTSTWIVSHTCEIRSLRRTGPIFLPNGDWIVLTCDTQ